MYRRGNFKCHHQGCTSIYRPLSYPYIKVLQLSSDVFFKFFHKCLQEFSNIIFTKKIFFKDMRLNQYSNFPIKDHNQDCKLLSGYIQIYLNTCGSILLSGHFVLLFSGKFMFEDCVLKVYLIPSIISILGIKEKFYILVNSLLSSFMIRYLLFNVKLRLLVHHCID